MARSPGNTGDKIAGATPGRPRHRESGAPHAARRTARPTARRRRRARPESRGAIERLDGGGQRFGAIGLHQHTMRRHLRNGGRARGDDGLGGRHGFQQHDAEAFLNAGQAEESARLYSARSGRAKCRPATPPCSRASTGAKAGAARGARAIADDAHFQIRDAAGERRGGAQQHIQALAPVEPADEEHGEPRRIRGVESEQAAPLAEIDRLRHDGRELAQTVELLRALAGVAAGHQDAGRALDVQPLAARLHRHGEARQAGFEADLVGNDPLQRGDMRRAAGDAIAIHIEADGKIEVRGGLSHRLNQQALECIHRQTDARGRELDGVAQAFERRCQDVNPDVGAAAALDIQRSGSEESDSHSAGFHCAPLAAKITLRPECRKRFAFLSGGLDSATCLALARREGYACYALSFDYGQRHKIELEAARRVAASIGVERHLVATIGLDVFGGSALTGDMAVPKARSTAEMSHGIPVTYVPARNTIFLSFALAWAEVLESSDVFIGVNALDYSGYPDCRPEYIEAYERMANLATRAGVEGRTRLKIHTPLIGLTKAQIVTLGQELGLDFSLTFSCYDPGPGGRPCGQCDACLLRRKGFQEAGIEDR